MIVEIKKRGRKNWYNEVPNGLHYIERACGCWLAHRIKVYILGMDFKNNHLKLLAL